MTISTDSSQISNVDSIYVQIVLTNQANDIIWIPENFTFTSDIYPNPKEQKIQGGTVNFKLDPLDKFGSIIIEDIVFISDIKLQKLRPNKSVSTTYNLGLHIKDYLSLMDISSIPSQIDIYAEYIFKRKTKHSKTFKGLIKSNTLTIFLNK